MTLTGAAVVSAEPHRAATTTRWLGELGFRTEVAWDREGGARLVLDSQPEVVLIDARLPDGCGIELCAQLKRNVGSVTHVIVIGAGDLDLGAAFRAGADGFVRLPVRRRELRAQLRAAPARWHANVGACALG